MWVLQHHSAHAFDMRTTVMFVYLGLQVKLNQFNSNNSHHTSCKHKGLHAGKWPDLLTSKPDYVSSLGYHWTDDIGRPLEPLIHWYATGTTLADASIQWLPTVLFSVASQRTLGSKFQAHWIATRLPLNYHWLRVRAISGSFVRTLVLATHSCAQAIHINDKIQMHKLHPIYDVLTSSM